jgi:serine/threonine protein kinase
VTGAGAEVVTVTVRPRAAAAARASGQRRWRVGASSDRGSVGTGESTAAGLWLTNDAARPNVYAGTVTSTDGDERGGANGPLTFSRGDVVAGRYTVLELIGTGGAGEVYRVTDRALGGIVALKTLRLAVAKHPKLVERFRREVQNARKVTHPNVCRIFDLGVHEVAGHKRFFLTMELLAGESLAQNLADGGPWSPAEARPLLEQLAGGLQAAHDASIVHRDLKPGNVVLTPARAARGAARAVITDFGLAISEEQIALRLTESSEVIGTPDYMAPEQMDPGATTPAIDVYALGIIAYELLTKRRPFDAAPTAIAALLRRQQEPPRPLRSLLPDVDPAWEAAIMRCLERDPKKRFARADAFVSALDGPAPAATSPTGGAKRLLGRLARGAKGR